MNRLYLRLAWSNLKNSRQFYLPYVIAGMLSAMMFYTMCAIQGNDGLSKMRGGSSVQIVLYFGVVVVGVFVSIFLFYTNSFIMKRRKKELGVYNILGMEKIHVAKIMAWETVFSFLIAVGGGLITGIVFQKLLTMFLYRLTGLEAAIPFYISGWGCLHTAEMFGAIYVCILLYNLMQIRLSNPVELLHSGNTGEREPKTKIIQAVLGILCIVTGYYIAITTDNPVKAVSLFFVAVMLVIVGTYFLFNAGSIAFLKLLRKNKRYYYQTRHFTTVSGMIYRMKQNAVGLANICILSTMVLVVISMTVCMYAGIEDELKTQYPAELELIFYDPDGQQDAQTFNRMADEIERVIKENGRVITGKQKGSYVGTAVAMTGNKITALDRSAMDFSNMYVLEIMTKDGFEEYMQETIPDIPDVVIEKYLSGDELIASGCEPDILFLDIQMPGMDGMETARILRQKNEKMVLIFVTAVEEYVFQAFDVAAFHYLVKPFSDEKFEEVVKRAVRSIEKYSENQSDEKYMMVQSGGSHMKVFLKDIVYAEVYNRKVIIHTRDTNIEYYGKLQELSEIVGADFFRTHRAYLVHFKYVQKYDANCVTMENGTALIAKQNYSEFVKQYLKYNQRKGKEIG